MKKLIIVVLLYSTKIVAQEIEKDSISLKDTTLPSNILMKDIDYYELDDVDVRFKNTTLKIDKKKKNIKRPKKVIFLMN